MSVLRIQSGHLDHDPTEPFESRSVLRYGKEAEPPALALRDIACPSGGFPLRATVEQGDMAEYGVTQEFSTTTFWTLIQCSLVLSQWVWSVMNSITAARLRHAALLRNAGEFWSKDTVLTP